MWFFFYILETFLLSSLFGSPHLYLSCSYQIAFLMKDFVKPTCFRLDTFLDTLAYFLNRPPFSLRRKVDATTWLVWIKITLLLFWFTKRTNVATNSLCEAWTYFYSDNINMGSSGWNLTIYITRNKRGNEGKTEESSLLGGLGGVWEFWISRECAVRKLRMWGKWFMWRNFSYEWESVDKIYMISMKFHTQQTIQLLSWFFLNLLFNYIGCFKFERHMNSDCISFVCLYSCKR